MLAFFRSRIRVNRSSACSKYSACAYRISAGVLDLPEEYARQSSFTRFVASERLWAAVSAAGSFFLLPEQNIRELPQRARAANVIAFGMESSTNCDHSKRAREIAVVACEHVREASKKPALCSRRAIGFSEEILIRLEDVLRAPARPHQCEPSQESYASRISGAADASLTNRVTIEIASSLSPQAERMRARSRQNRSCNC